MSDVDAASTLVVEQAPKASPAGVASDGGLADLEKALPGYVKGQLGEDGQALVDELRKMDPKAAKEFVSKLPKGTRELYKDWRTATTSLQSAIVRPSKEAPPEAWDRYWKQVGRPESPDGYAFERPTNLPEGVRYSEDVEKWFKSTSHKYGLTVEQAKGLFGDYNNMQIGAAKNIIEKQKQAIAADLAKRQQETAAGTQALQQAWGANFETNKAGALQVLSNPAIVPASWAAKIKSAGLDTDPDTLFVLHTLHRVTKEDTKIGAPTESGEPMDEALDPKTGRHVIRHPKTRARYKASGSEE